MEDRMSLNSKPEQNIEIFTNMPINFRIQLSNVISL